MYEFLVFVHLVGVLTFVGAHGVSMGVLFRLRRERDPAAVNQLLNLSGLASRVFYLGFLLLLVGGIAAGFVGHWWSQAWIWASIGVLVIVTGFMYGLASPYYRRVRLIAGAMAGGSEAVTSAQFDQVLRSPRAMAVAWIGLLGLLAIVAMMVFKPTFGLGSTPTPSASCAPNGTELSISAADLSFDKDCLAAPADTAFTIAFDNTSQVLHNVAILDGGTALFTGPTFTGPKITTYDVPALPAGTYTFRCDVHPTQMTGTFVVGGASSAPASS
jgi:plastocyanin